MLGAYYVANQNLSPGERVGYSFVSAHDRRDFSQCVDPRHTFAVRILVHSYPPCDWDDHTSWRERRPGLAPSRCRTGSTDQAAQETVPHDVDRLLGAGHLRVIADHCVPDEGSYKPH